MTGMKKKKVGNNKGFTMAELLMAIAVLVILFGLIFVGVIQHQRKLKQMEMDNVAREIFVAAQNHLTAEVASGSWEDFYEKATRDEKTDPSKSAAVLGEKMKDPGKEYYAPAAEGDPFASPDHDFRVITSVNGKSSVSSTGEAEDENALSKILPAGSIDATVTSHIYVIEYDAKSGAIFSVSYTDAKGATLDQFYGDGYNNRRDSKGPDGKIKEGSGASARRNKPISGYYGGSLALLTQDGGLIKPVVYTRNAESLVLYVYDFNTGAAGALDALNRDRTITVRIKGKTSGKEIDAVKQLSIYEDPEDGPDGWTLPENVSQYPSESSPTITTRADTSLYGVKDGKRSLLFAMQSFWTAS